MQNSDQSAHGWARVMTMLIQASRSARECLLSALFVVLLLSATGIPLSPAVQAQDARTGIREQATVRYQLVSASQTIGTICIGETKSIHIAIVASVQVFGDPNTGSMTAHGVGLYGFSEDPRILSVDAEVAPAPSVGDPGSVGYVLGGIAAGSTFLSVEAEGNGNTALPDLTGVHFALPVQLIPCEYRVTATSSWFGFSVSGNVRITAHPDEVTLTREEGETTFVAQERLTYVHLDATSNRFKGCLPDHETYSQLPPAALF